MKEQFDGVFRSIDNGLKEKETTAVLNQMDSEGEHDGIDVMISDYEEEDEVIEYEMEEDGTFINDDYCRNEDPSFYRTLNQELDERLPVVRNMEKTENKRQHPLLKLKVTYLISFMFTFTFKLTNSTIRFFSGFIRISLLKFKYLSHFIFPIR